jgi:DNA-binding transcriptional LysR family regulator
MGRPRLDYSWQLQSADGETVTMSHSPRLVTDGMSALREAALQGVGIVQLPTIYICDDIEAGRLINVLPDWSPEPGIVHAIFPSRQGLLPSVRALVDFLVRECAIQRAAANRIVPPPTRLA